MKKVVLVCCLLVSAVWLFAFADQETQIAGKDGSVPASVYSSPASDMISVPVNDGAAYEMMKDRYYVLIDRVETGVATEYEVTELREMCFSWDLPLPASLEQDFDEAQRDGDPLDQGGVDTTGSCADATVIGSLPYSDSGNYDGDNDCSVVSASPYNEVFYTYTAAATGYHQFRARSYTTGAPAIRVMTACCAGATSVAFSSSSVAGDCGEPTTVVTYLRATLTAGTTYWIHVGTSSSTSSTLGYDFSMDYIPCPPEESADAHNTCETAQVIACNDSIFGDSATSANPDWYQVTLAEDESLKVFVGGRELGHCVSGAYPGNSTLAVDGRFTIFSDCAQTCPDSVGYDQDSGCSFDAKKAFCLRAGTYYIKVWNADNDEYVLTVECGPGCTPEPALTPTNDLCADAITVAVPSSTNGTTVCATTDVVPTCANGYTVGARSVWYKVVGNGNLLTADICTASYDTRLAVYTGTCDALVCLDGDDDDCTAPNGLGSTVTWCSDAGVEYLIYVNAFSSSSSGQGTFTLVITDGANCHIDCENYPPCGTPAEVEPNDSCYWAANFLDLACNTDGSPAYYYGTICPQADVDYYHIPGISFGWTLSIRLLEGENCDVFPPVGLRMRGATNSDGTCGPATGTLTTSYLLGGCNAFTGGYIAVVRNTLFENKYKLEVICTPPSCPNEVLPNQHCSSCAGPIPDNPAVQYAIDVPIEYHITDLNVRVDITHTFDGDIDMWLITPWGDTLELTTDNGGSGDNFQVTVFDDEGANGPITAGTAPFNGSYIPEELLAGVDGFNAIGTWWLLIDDDAGGDIGFVNCWCLEFEYDVILAAELNGFDAIPGDGQVEVTWSTASESNNDRFEIVRDGATVAQVEATNQPSGDSYSWTDRDLTNGRTYRYTLVSVDLNGAREELAVESVTPTAGAAVITEYALHQNYPNPFNPQTSITFDLVESGVVSLKVFNLMGQEVAALVNRSMDAGRHVVSFDAANLPSGLYLYKVEANGFSDQKKMLLLK